MSIHVALNHVTHYRYDRPVHLGPQVVRLRPAPHSRTRILSYSMRVEPATHFVNWQQDPQSNYLARLVFPDKTTSFRIEVDLVAEMSVLNPFDFFLEPSAENFPFDYAPELAHELAPFRVKGELTPRLAAYLDAIPREKKQTTNFLVELNQRLQQDISYLIRMEPGVQTPETTLENGSGSCRDTGWLLVQILRHLGFAARFVSGYLIQLKSDVKSLDGPSGTEVDFTDLHAWCEVYLPGAGWIGLDPTSGLLAGEGHIPLACSPEPGSAAPVTGALDECEVEFEHRMAVSRVWEAPRVTLPYTDGQWAGIEALGHQVDEDLRRHDVRLTQGGEPTFVSVDDRDGAEWNTEALGPTKRLLAADLMDKLRAKYGQGGLLHYGQGKWYPGEQLPRWSLNLYWRKDREPIWTHPELFASEHEDHGATELEARKLLAGVARRLGVDAQYVFPAYEDTWYYLWRERRLPTNVDPFDARLSDPLERERVRKVFSQGLDKVVGHVLPIQRNPAWNAAPRWQTGPWFLRAERCYLIPGDSALGYRLPLDSQPWTAPGDYPWVHPVDQTQSFAPLPPYRRLRFAQGASEGAWGVGGAADAAAGPGEGGAGATGSAVPGGGAGGFAGGPGSFAERSRAAQGGPAGPSAASAVDVRRPAPFESASWLTRTAMCAEPRNGRIYVFMPPTAALEDYLEIVAAVEDTALEMKLPVILEGYEPPKDPRLSALRVTPDPGVIEVNIHPAHSWEELVDQTTHLYQSAHETRLSTEKFMLDGRHTGTGGGNHFVLGGATVADSPFLRRPDLLASMVAYWHNHPSLSYLFSGLFIGPTSQAPRIDEARNDSVYEMEIAFGELRRLAQQGGRPAPWLIDRVLRNLLIDATGNTHRAEFCIDKLYSPDGPTGRLGLLEMRAFEMPPHARMSLTQQLLMRALVARFWKQPFQPAHLKRWGTELHDRFMLPHFVWDDLSDVLEELNDYGYPVQADWFAPHLNFRFPRLGDFSARGVEVELRLALEPWHVMGEEGAPGGTVRFVDSSVERLQVKVTGLVDKRHVLTCNGRVVPLQSTGRVGEFVAGVRYRAWQPPSALHPTIGVHAPLTFDLVDTWMSRSMGGCQYHVSHPGGRNYDSFPVNAYEAEARRLARFFRVGHTPGTMSVPREERNPNFPFTLDLRRPTA
ncbi:transglutaminase family protein [Piscinibacter sakaiensis]|uniref:Transglutaminase-like domain protein n=1 Tax=Piscinibacter sakaiensis TaxID=1547922 RepID=A0A0K8P7K1_PISS1|nr:transglutaminase family protein [Piscinibacter sakaiensis]GAP38509.1 transglutaminase-like domain protein [Piscinibacter sakaiensis]